MLTLVVALLFALPLAAQETPPLAPDERFTPPAAQPAPEATPDSDGMQALQRDIREMKQDMELLQETLDLIVNRMMADLEKENAQLRSELRRLQEAGPAPADAAPEESSAFVPRPGAALFEEVAQEPMPEELPPPAPEFTWEIIAEWGRDPQAAAQLGDDVQSLKGMVVVVPPGSAREDVEDLGRHLRSEYEPYDNINIEVFDDYAAGQSFADRQVADPTHRLLSVSKHKASGRDKILYIGGSETVQEVGVQGASPTSEEPEPAPEE